MARRKITFEEVREAFARAEDCLPGGAQLLPVNGDDGKAMLMTDNGCTQYSCQALRGHLEFLLTLE